jgi:hypothetical protein
MKREIISMFDLVQELKKIPEFIETSEDNTVEYAVETYFSDIFKGELEEANFPFELEERWKENEEGYDETITYIVLKRKKDNKFFILDVHDTGQIETDALTLSDKLVEVKRKTITKTIWDW